MNNEQILDVSWETIFKMSIAIFCLYLLYLIRDILAWIIFALIISILFNPAIDFLQRRKFPRTLATILIYFSFFELFGFLIYLIAPNFVFEIQQFTQLFPQYFEKAAPFFKSLGIVAFENFEVFTKTIQDWLIKASVSIFNAIFSIFGGIFSAISIFTIAFFLSLEEKSVERVIALLSPKKYEAYVLDLYEKCQRKVAGWFGARVFSSIFVGFLSFFACYVFKIKYAVSFALLAGILEIIPVVGPLITGVMIFVFTALDSWLKATFILITFILIQQIESNILNPLLSRKFVGLPPVLVLISLMIGGKLWGFLGAILVIPLAGIIYEFLRDFLKKKKEEATVVL